MNERIQIKGKGIENEPNMAEYIRKTIPRHNMFFAPVIYFSPVSKEEFVSSKMRDVGGKTLEEHLLERKDQDPLFLSHLLDTHLYLTLGADKLVQANMVHFNIHEKNILFDDKIQSPVMTEFGLSSKIPVNPFPLPFPFPLPLPFPFPLPNKCLELHFMSDMVKVSNWETKTIPKNWEQKIETYFEEMKFIPDSLKRSAIKKWKNYIEKYNHKKGKYIWSQWSQYWNTWDNYAIIYIYAIILMQSTTLYQSSSFLESYHAILTNTLLSTPDKRDTPVQTINKLDALVSSLNAEDYAKWITSNNQD